MFREADPISATKRYSLETELLIETAKSLKMALITFGNFLAKKWAGFYNIFCLSCKILNYITTFLIGVKYALYYQSLSYCLVKMVAITMTKAHMAKK